jgi:hypothetical protein
VVAAIVGAVVVLMAVAAVVVVVSAGVAEAGVRVRILIAWLHCKMVQRLRS